MTDRPDYWDVRLHNWALYYFGGSTQGSSSLCLLAILADATYWNDESRESALIGEAMDTAELVHKLIIEQQKALKAWYWASGTKEFIAQSIGVHRKTLWQRVRDAKDNLSRLQHETRRSLPVSA